MSPAIDLARALVAIPSVNPHYDPASPAEDAISRWIEDWAHGHGITVRTDEVLPDRRNVILTVTNGAPRPHVLLCGHMDTVGVAGMTIDPFVPTMKDGRLHGRGSADMKGPLAAMLHALLVLRDDPGSWRGTVSVACVVDEEFQARGVKALMARETATYDHAVVGEPTRLEVVRGCKGCLRFGFTAEGRAAHSSNPGNGRNAIVAVSEAILALEDYFGTALAQVTRPGFGCSTGSVGLIEGGSGISIVPDRCRASVDIRLLPGQAWPEVYAAVKTCVQEKTTRVPDIRWVFDEPPFTDPSFETPAEAALVSAALAELNRPAAEIVGYCCDASKIAARGIPSIVLGPGDIAQAHTANESIPLAEIDAAVNAYAGLARRLLPAT